MLGIFGLGRKPTNFSDFTDPQPSFLWSLRNQSLIPSLSYGYSAGAFYKAPQILGSLTLGGYNSARLKSHNLTFPFGPDDSRILLVGLQSIQADHTFSGMVSLLGKGIMSLIDSTVPEIWLPIEACEGFERAFGLIYDESTYRYIVNDTTHSKLKEMNPKITFRLGLTDYGGETVNIELPYAAFDLQAKYPIYQNSINYFPLRRATNEAQYVIGRTFLQEAYIVVDYERSSFSVAQAVNHDGSQIVTINPLESDNGRPDKEISRAAIIGIVVSVVAITILGFVGGSFSIRRWNYRKMKSKNRNQLAMRGPSDEKELNNFNVIKVETANSNELDSRDMGRELGPECRHEIGEGEMKAELPARRYKHDGHIEPVSMKY